MAPRIINLLSSVQTAEVSLVKRGANNKVFAITKSEDTQMDFNELLKTILSTEAEGEQALLKSLEGADKDTIAIATANYRLQHGFKDKLSKEQFEQVSKAAGYEILKTEGTDDNDPKNQPPFKPKKTKTEKSHTPADMPKEMEAIFKAQQLELTEVKKQLEVETDNRIRKEYIEKCSKYTHVPGMNTEEMGIALQKAYEVSEDFGKQLEKQWAATSEAIQKSKLIASQGVVATPNSNPSVSTKAQELMQKDSGLTQSEAILKVYEQNPELYTEYLNDHPGQTGRRS